MLDRDKAVRQGVEDAFNGWLADHPISMDDLVTEAIRLAFTGWLNDHADEVLAIVAGTARATTEETLP